MKLVKIKDLGYSVETPSGRFDIPNNEVIAISCDGVRCRIDTFEDGYNAEYTFPTDWVSVVLGELTDVDSSTIIATKGGAI